MFKRQYYNIKKPNNNNKENIIAMYIASAKFIWL